MTAHLWSGLRKGDSELDVLRKRLIAQFLICFHIPHADVLMSALSSYGGAIAQHLYCKKFIPHMRYASRQSLPRLRPVISTQPYAFCFLRRQALLGAVGQCFYCTRPDLLRRNSIRRVVKVPCFSRYRSPYSYRHKAGQHMLRSNPER